MERSVLIQQPRTSQGTGTDERPRRRREHSRLALPLLVAIGGCAATYWFWGALLQERRSSAADRAGAVAESLTDSLEEAVGSLLRNLGALLDLHTVDGLEAPRLSRIAREDFGFSSLEVSVSGGGDDGRAAAATASRQTGVFVRPPHLEIVGRLDRREVRARFRLEQLFEAQLGRRAPDYAIRVHDRERLLYARGEAAAHQEWWVQTRSIDLPDSAGEWRLTLAPSVALARLPVANLPAYFRTAGVMISLLMAALLYQSSVARVRHRELERSHTNLRSEIQVRERAEEELRSLNLGLERRVADRTSELDTAVADLEAFTYSVSHDLRSPLGAVVNFAGILNEDYGRELGEEGRDHLERLTASALSALAMMDGLAALSRLGRARAQIVAVDVGALAEEVFDEVVVSAPTSAARLEVGVLPRARGDASMLRTVFTNLFTNALKFAAPERPLVVEVGARSADGETVYWVQDNGVGFERRFSERVFRLFERLHGDLGYSGTGIGLAIVARVIRFHGGRVWAEGEPDRGARFSFTLPGAD